MTDLSGSGAAGRLVPRRGPYADAIARLSRAAFRPLPQSTRNALTSAFLSACVVVAILIATQPAAVWIAAVCLLLAATLVPSLRVRWAWPWQAVLLAEAGRHRADLADILGKTLDRQAGAEWLVRNSDAPARDRLAVLGFIGYDDLAEELIPELPEDTAEDRFWRAFEVIGRDWRRTGRMATEPAAALVADLSPERQTAARVSLDFARALAALSVGGDLRSLAAPTRVPRSLGTIPALVLVRFWFTTATIAGLAIVLVSSVIVGGIGR